MDRTMGGRHLPRTPGRLSKGRGRRSTSGSKQWDDPVPLLPFAPHPTTKDICHDMHQEARLRVSHVPRTRRSEEHTSELQSLMRISYAVFCLKKKIQRHIHTFNKQQ